MQRRCPSAPMHLLNLLESHKTLPQYRISEGCLQGHSLVCRPRANDTDAFQNSLHKVCSGLQAMTFMHEAQSLCGIARRSLSQVSTHCIRHNNAPLGAGTRIRPTISRYTKPLLQHQASLALFCSYLSAMHGCVICMQALESQSRSCRTHKAVS
jgi:hypothetical protein